MYCATTGTFLQRDPIGNSNGPVLGYSHEAVTRIMNTQKPASNLYEYVQGMPLVSVDPYGLYKVFFGGGNWTEEQRNRINNQLASIPGRARALKDEATAELAKLPACERAELERAVNKFINLMQGMIEGSESSTPLYFYHEQSTRDAPAWTFAQYGWKSNQIHFNDSISNGWTQMDATAFGILVFHEMTHLGDTLDDATDLNSELNNAHSIDDMFGGTFTNNPYWTAMKRAAAQKCSNKPKPTRQCPPDGGDGFPGLYILFL